MVLIPHSFFFFETVLLCNPNWPQLHEDLPVSALWVLHLTISGLIIQKSWMGASTPSFLLVFLVVHFEKTVWIFAILVTERYNLHDWYGKPLLYWVNSSGISESVTFCLIKKIFGNNLREVNLFRLSFWKCQFMAGWLPCCEPVMRTKKERSRGPKYHFRGIPSDLLQPTTHTSLITSNNAVQVRVTFPKPLL